MNNTKLAVILIPTFAALYAGGINNSIIMCYMGISLMTFNVLNVFLQ